MDLCADAHGVIGAAVAIASAISVC